MSTPEAPNLERLHNDLQVEYGKLVDIVTSYDQRLLTIKGWGVTLSLASLGLGFQQNHYGLFLVAAASGFAFWLLEVHQDSPDPLLPAHARYRGHRLRAVQGEHAQR